MREDRLQYEIAQKLRAKDYFFFHVPNGGTRNKNEAAKFAAIGLKPGIPDLVICLQNGITLFVELKVSSGALSKPQQIVHRQLKTLSHHVLIVKTDCSQQAFDLIEQKILEICKQ